MNNKSQFLFYWFIHSIATLAFCAGCDSTETTVDEYQFEAPVHSVVVRVIGDAPVDIEIIGANVNTSTVEIQLEHDKMTVPFERGIAEQAYQHRAVLNGGILLVELEMKDYIFCYNGQISISVPFTATTVIESHTQGNIFIREMQNDIHIEAKTSDIALQDISGDVSVYGTGISYLSLERIHGNISAEGWVGSSFLDTVTGNLNFQLIRAGYISGSNISGNTIDIHCSNGVDLSFSTLFQQMDITATAGDVFLHMPATSCDINTYAPRGIINLPPATTPSTQNCGIQSIKAFSGNITVQNQTTSADVPR